MFAIIESLESRVMLSGNITASVIGGTVILRGDSGNNAITIDQAGLTGTQLRLTGTGGTLVNQQSRSIVVSGVSGAFIRMGRGGDSVTLQNLSLSGTVAAIDESGMNTLVTNNIHLGNNLTVHNQSSSSTTVMANTSVGQNLAISAKAGGQVVVLQGVQVGGATTIVSDGGRPTVLMVDDSVFHGTVAVQTGSSADLVELDTHGAVNGPSTTFGSDVSISLGGGRDVLRIGVAGEVGNRDDFFRPVTFDGGTGFDSLVNFTPRNPRFTARNFESITSSTDVKAPVVSSTGPAAGSTGIAINGKITATFSETMNPVTITGATVLVRGPGNTAVAGTVRYSGTTMTFAPTRALAANTAYTTVITRGATDLAGNPLAANYSWRFTTGATLDATAPTVVSTDPADGSTVVARNRKVAVTFSEAMDPLTLTAASVIVTAPGQGRIAGSVSTVGNIMTFTPTTTLTANTRFTVTITTGAKDVAGNSMASSFFTAFNTGSNADLVAPTVTLTNPTNLQTNVVINKTVAGSFSESMDVQTITAATFTLKAPGNILVNGTVGYDAVNKIASFVPASNLAANTTFTATLTGGAAGVKDLAGNAMAVSKVWTFTTGTQVAQGTINLGAAGAFAVMATASITSTGATVINGDVGLNPGSAQGIPPAQVHGNIHIDDSAIIQAQAALLSAYNDAVNRSVTPISMPGNIGGSTLTPGLYTNSTSVLIQGVGTDNNVTLDAQGDPNAVFIFQMGSTLTTGVGSQVILIGGAKAANVFWQVGTSATINTTNIFKGSIIASATITVNQGSAVEGRLLGGANSAGSVTINASTVTVPSA